MSRYLILVLLNTPLIIYAIFKSVVAYKLDQIGMRRLVYRIIFWLVILAGLIFAKPLYDLLFTKNLTQTEPLSLFDVVQITGIICAFFVASQAYSKAEILEKNVQELHRELSIRMSRIDRKK